MEDRSGKMRLKVSWFVIEIHSASISTSKIACIQWQVISDQFCWRLAAEISMHSTGKGTVFPWYTAEVKSDTGHRYGKN